MTSRSEGDCRRDDVLGINRRNLECVAVRNPRRNFRNADDKVLAKEILGRAGLPTPRTVYVVEGRHRIDDCLERMRASAGCAVKPAEGFGVNKGGLGGEHGAGGGVGVARMGVGVCAGGADGVGGDVGGVGVGVRQRTEPRGIQSSEHG